jgi:putative colanic acid biosynthesis acetyltransferase WcaF
MIQNLGKFNLPKGFRGRNGLAVQVWWMVQSTFFAWSPQFAYGWRCFILRCFGAKVGNNVIIRPTVRVTYPWKVTIGNYTWIGDNAELYSLGEISIGNNVVISQKSYLCAASHDYQSESFDIFAKKIVIEDEAWLATDVFVAPGVTIGRGAVIGARSSVFSDMPAGMICLGSPAKPVKPRVD